MSPTRDECVANASRIYEGILADPVRAAQIRAGRAALAAERASATQTAGPTSTGEKPGRLNTTRKSA